MVLNWFQPSTCNADQAAQGEPVVCFLTADSVAALADTGLTPADLTWEASGICNTDVCPEWIPVLEPVTSSAPNYAVLGYARDEVIWDPDDPRINPVPPTGDIGPVITGARWLPDNARRGYLEIAGEAGPRDRVEIVNADNDDQILRVRADRSARSR